MCRKFHFAEIEQRIKLGQTGIYEIHTVSGMPLKVGIAIDLRKRLIQHRASRQNALKLKPGGKWLSPKDVLSKQSILAKHLYYDATIAPRYDLKSEAGRREFLEKCCVIIAQPTSCRNEARTLEKQREAIGEFRYFGKVRIR